MAYSYAITPSRYSLTPDTLTLWAGEAGMRQLDWPANRNYLPGLNPEAGRTTRYTVSGGYDDNPASMFDVLRITKNPALKGMADDFSTSLKGLMANLNATQPTRLSDYTSGLSDLNRRFSGDTAGMVGRYGDVLSQYEMRGKGALDAELANAQAIQQQLREAQAQALGLVGRNANLASMSRYGAGGPTGIGSALQKELARQATQVALPYSIEGNRAVGSVLSRYQPFYGDVASRQAGQITGLELPLAENIYGKDLYALNQADATTQRALAEKGAQLALLQQYGQLSPLYEWTNLNYRPGATALTPQYSRYSSNA